MEDTQGKLKMKIKDNDKDMEGWNGMMAQFTKDSGLEIDDMVEGNFIYLIFNLMKESLLMINIKDLVSILILKSKYKL